MVLVCTIQRLNFRAFYIFFSSNTHIRWRQLSVAWMDLFVELLTSVLAIDVSPEKYMFNPQACQMR